MFYNCRCVCFWVLIFFLCFLGIPFEVLINEDDNVRTLATKNESIMDIFKNFTQKYSKTYEDYKEFWERFEVFKANFEEAAKLNQKRLDNESAFFGITKFSDLTKEEFMKTHLRINRPNKYKRPHLLLMSGHKNSVKLAGDLPRRVDWRDRGVISPVQDQQMCGGCWAFSTIGTVESMYAIKTGTLRQLSVQQLLDCSGGGNMGCQGGDTCTAIEWLVDNKIKVVPSKKYPLMLRNQMCRKIKSPNCVELSGNYTCDDLEDSEYEMMKLLAKHGPLIAAVDSTTWQHYLGGIIRFHCPNDHNHAVQIVGYDRTGSVPYYIVKNSWGKQFGLDGYVHVAIGNNLCGIANEVSSVDVKAS